jgi:hypothetical protein
MYSRCCPSTSTVRQFTPGEYGVPAAPAVTQASAAAAVASALTGR